MATRPYIDDIPLTVPPEMARAVAWELNTGDVGEPFDLAGFADRSIQVIGTPAGTTVIIEGTLVNAPDDSDYATLNDAFGVPLSLTAAGLHAVAEAVRWVRPRATGGAAAGLSIHLFALGR